MSMSAAQARAALQEVMQYAEEGIHYDDDGELRLLTERVPSYFDVRVNVRASITANGEESLRARMLLARFTEAHDLRVDNSADTSPYSLRKVVGWMCTEGMSNEGDVDMTKQQKVGTYMPADFKQTLMTQAKKWGMLVEDSKDEMKSGAAEILVLSRLKDIPQAPPQDFQNLPVIIANGVEYVLLDQLVDFMKKKPDDRNVILEALHDVTEQALADKDLINYRVRSADEDVVCGTPLWDEIFMATLHRLSIATSEVDRKRSREEGWKLVAMEADVALHAADEHTSAGEEIVRTVSIVRSPINTMSTEEVEEEDVFNEWTMTEQQRERGFEDSSLPIDFEYDIEETRVRNNEKDARAPNYEVEVSGSDVSRDKEGEEYDAYWDMEAGGGQTSKGWPHAILRLTSVFSNPHLLLRVVLKEATPEGALQYAALTTIMRSCSNGKRWSQPPGEGINICCSRTGQLSHHVQTVIRADKGVDTNGKTRYVIPLSLYLDKTHVDGRQKQSAYPLMMSIVDRASDATLLTYLPVLQHRPCDKGWGLHSTAFRKRKVVILHKALSIVLRSTKEASHDGMIVTTERFGEITVHPFVMNYIQDYPERCALANVKFGVCPTCTMSKHDFDVIADFTNCRRSQTLETQLAANCFNNGDNDIHRAAEARMSELNMHKHVQENGLWGFYRGPHGDDPQLDYHLALRPDRAHTIEHGNFLHMIDAFKAAAYKKLPDIAQTEILHEMDARLQSVSERCVRTYPQLVLPMATGSDEWEHHYQRFCKQPYLASNKRKAASQMVNHVRRSLALEDEMEIVRKRRKRSAENWSSVTDCMATGINTLAARDTTTLQLRWFQMDGVHLPEVEGISNAALRILNELPCKEDFRAALATFMTENGCQPSSDNQVIHTRTHDGTHRGAGVQTARASPQFHGRVVHNDVAVRGGNDNIWYASVAMFFVMNTCTGSVAEMHKCCFVQWYKEVDSEREHTTGCKKLQWEKVNGYQHNSVITIDTIIETMMTTDDVQYPQMVHEPLLSIAGGNRSRVTENNDGQKRPIAIVMDSFQQSGRQEWKALRTFLWYEYLNEADKAGVLTPETVNTSWVTCRDVLGSNEEGEEEDSDEQMSEEVEHERMQEQGKGDDSDADHDVDAEESNPEGNRISDNTDRSEEVEEEEEGNSEDEETEITSAVNSAKCGTDEKKAGALETSSNDKQIVQRENVPLQGKMKGAL
ncbi:hypothetical protein CBR_g36692 [Chara braunii]|uniref:Uncharacterized protein n=1 Tax=Chara braunii TaxID=69332 RepID=A0A388LLH5_CHABU|nr:hypothetical protein CBR_g36692 [Chara braunii]|eukprot:GBG83075.1 hypothetical protein CBR_g36692 [Chara braunii]